MTLLKEAIILPKLLWLHGQIVIDIFSYLRDHLHWLGRFTLMSDSVISGTLCFIFRFLMTLKVTL